MMKQVKIINLLITARDPATALSFNKLLLALSIHPQFAIDVIMQGPAISLVTQIDKVTYYKLSTIENALALLNSIHSKNRINAVLTGISGPDLGIDEISLCFAQTQDIPSYSLQSFWGDFNQNITTRPDTIFTLDKQASQINQARFPRSRNIDIGSIKHIDFNKVDAAKIRHDMRCKLKSHDKLVIGFYGQPLAEISGYFTTLKIMVSELSQWSRSFQFIYRPHPKEPSALRDKSWQLFKQAFAEAALLDTSPDVINSLCACDIVVSAFSTCGIDAVYLNLNSKAAINSSVYLLFEPELLSWWQHYSQMKVMPLTGENNLILPVTQSEHLLTVLDKALVEKDSLKNKAEKFLPDPSNSINLIINTICNDISGQKNML